jgi:hypothetical protein
MPYRIPKPVRPSSATPRRGTVLVLFALFLFAFMGLAALVIDLGFARLTQLQMQSAADSAAMEGMWQQADPNPDLTQEQRRIAVREHVQYIFDDDFDPSDDAMNFGAGPQLNFSGGIPLTSEFNASQLIEPPHDDPVYKPWLELNLNDEPHGDMAAGSYVFPEEPLFEDRWFFRNDFSAGNGNTAFLVRLRRASGRNPLDSDPDVSSSGPALPYLFGRGSLLHPTLRGRGITVRATGIASGVPAKSVGVRAAELERGLLPIELEYSYWTTTAPETTLDLEISGNSIVVSGSIPPQEVGRIIRDATPVVVGEVVREGDPSAFNDESFSNVIGYIAIVDTILNADGMGSTDHVVVGFAQASLTKESGDSFSLTVNERVLAEQNASAIFVHSPSTPNLDWSDFMSKHNNEELNFLLAPASVR